MARKGKQASGSKRDRPESYNKQRRVQPSQRKRRLSVSDSFVTEWQKAASQLEVAASQQRQDRVNETQSRNKLNQKQSSRYLRGAKKKNTCLDENQNAKVDHDRKMFFSSIDEPFSTVCGSCGELVSISSAKQCNMEFEDSYFAPLLGNYGACAPRGVYTIGITPVENGLDTVTICNRCDRSLRRGETPRYSAASGIVLCDIPAELAVLNDIEARMVGLGICFTSCYNIRGSGQECTKGHTINFWNDACRIAASLPRPVSKCGVVRLHTTLHNSNETSIFTVRPNIIRLALLWLREHNPLYESVEISEEVMASLETARLAKDDVTLVIDPADASKTDAQNINDDTNDDPLDCTESFELQTSGLGRQTESEQILSAIRQQRTPEVDVQMEGNDAPINEYCTNTLMQACFPTLFPDGCGGYNPLSTEHRVYTFELADYCCYLMRWHDRRFVMHRNFKFFCLNLIQRRQVDGLTRRLFQNKTHRSNDALGETLESHPSDGDSEMKPPSHETDSELTKRGRSILKTLKPYFRSVRGSGLYWADVRDELMGMIGNEALPTAWPTFFFTLSAADTVWPDFFRACDPSLTLRQARRLPARTRRKLLNQNPDIASRHFYRRFKAFFDHIINGDAHPLGKITDYFWRVEFQRRGSPHIHGLLWVDNAPDVLALSKTSEGRDELAAFVDAHISTMTGKKDRVSACICNVCTEKNSSEIDILGERPPELTDTQSTTCDVAELVARVQQHSCYDGSSCRVKSGTCRFHFPKAVQNQTRINVEQTGMGAVKIEVLSERDDSYTNNYSVPLLQTWRANMDLKLIGNAYGAAEYTAAYVSKAEPDTAKFRAAILKALENSENRPELSILRRVANASIATREVSAQEALWILQHNLPMFGKSRNVLKFKCLRHSHRFYRVGFDECLHEMESPPNLQDLTSQPQMEKAEKAYAARPDEGVFVGMTYREFCERYETCTLGTQPKQRLQRWPRLDKHGYIKARQKPQAIVKSPRLRVDITNADYCYSELFFNVPWRSLSELPEDDADCIQKYNSNIRLTDRASESHERQHQMDIQDAEHAAPCVEALPESPWTFVHQSSNSNERDNNSTPTPTLPVSMSTTKYTSSDYERARTFIKTVVKPFVKDRKRGKEVVGAKQSGECVSALSSYRYPIGLDNTNMSNEQWIPFSLCMKQSRHRHAVAASNANPTPVKIILNGEGGSGKSWLINHVVRDIHQIWGDHDRTVRNSKRVLLMAHHGSAAFNIKGTTICSALGLPQMNGNTYTRQYNPLESTAGGLKTLRRLQDKYTDVQMVIIDEYSVISCGMLFWIDRRLREIWPACRDVDFGGRDLILAGDMGQLSPVLPYSLATTTTDLVGTQRCGRRLWESIENVFTLRSQNRGQLDPLWYEALGRLREMNETKEDVALFNSRLLCDNLHPDWMDSATHIAYRNTDVNLANAECIRRYDPHTFNAIHEVVPNLKQGDVCQPLSVTTVQSAMQKASEMFTERDKIVAPSIQLAVGAPVTLTYNLEQSAGLCNGTKATVYDFMFGNDSSVPIVLIQVKDKYIGPSFLDTIPNIVPIPPQTISWSSGDKSIRTTRTGIPLRLAFAMTIHKVQGLTCPKLVFNPTTLPTSAFAYVALSRVRHRDDVVLTRCLQISETKLQQTTRVVRRSEWERLREKEKECRVKYLLCLHEMQTLALLHNTYHNL